MGSSNVIQASGSEITEIVDNIEAVIGDYPTMHVVMACLMLSLWLQKRQITSEQLQKGVTGASEWVALYLSGLDADPTGNMTAIGKGQMN